MTEESKHALFGASGFDAIALCPGKPVLEGKFPGFSRQQVKAWSGLDIPPDTGNVHANRGTVVHYMIHALGCNHSDPWSFVGQVFTALDGETFVEPIEVDEVMVQNAIDCHAYAVALAGDSGEVFWETRVYYGAELDDVDGDCNGTADILVFHDGDLHVIDYKNGYGRVSPDTSQLKLYGIGALRIAEERHWAVDTVYLTIVQPNVYDEPQAVQMTPGDLLEWAAFDAAETVSKAQAAFSAAVAGMSFPDWAEVRLEPGEAQCKYCQAARGGCPKALGRVAETLRASAPLSPDAFDEIDAAAETMTKDWQDELLGRLLDQVDFIEGLCKAWREEALRKLEEGEGVHGYKLVAGKRGARAWADREEAEQTLASMRLKKEEMYNYKLISPTDAEKLAKAGTLTDRRWKKLQPLIVQPQGKHHVAPLSDKRPALEIRATVDMFDDLGGLA